MEEEPMITPTDDDEVQLESSPFDSLTTTTTTTTPVISFEINEEDKKKTNQSIILEEENQPQGGKSIFPFVKTYINLKG